MFDVEAPKRTVVFIGKGLDRSGAKGSRIGEVVTLGLRRRAGGRGGGAAQGAACAASASSRPSSTASRWPRSMRSPSGAATRNTAWWSGRRPRSTSPSPSSPSTNSPAWSKDLNQTIRFAGLALGGAEGAITAARRVHLDQRLSAPRQLCDRRARLRSLPLGHRPHAEGWRGRSPGVDRVDLARACAARDRNSRPSCSARRD